MSFSMSDSSLKIIEQMSNRARPHLMRRVIFMLIEKFECGIQASQV